jgi:hypothetical protein
LAENALAGVGGADTGKPGVSKLEMAQLLQLEAKLLGSLGQESRGSHDINPRAAVEPLTESGVSPTEAGTAADVTVKVEEGEDAPASDRGLSTKMSSAEQEGIANDVIEGGPLGKHEDDAPALCKKEEPS